VTTSRSTKYFIYILKSNDGRFYTGYTTDLARRMKQHRTGAGAKFTRGFGFGKLLYHEKYRTRSKAMRREAEIKGLSRSEKEALIAPIKGTRPNS
jgi:putative endonuclease